ncbi:MAG: phosphoglycerate kinase [Bdellovibrionales bacterium]|nr:phosphoglycerate kinase [Bdellovibrionales bacterium]
MALESFLKLEDLDLLGQRVFLRLDLNVPMKDGKILDRTRIDAALPTLRYLCDKGARVVVASHLGRPKTEEDKQKYSLEPVAQALIDSGFEVLLMDSPESDAPVELIKGIGGNKIIMLENLRFAPGETKNSDELAAKWSKYTDIYVNDAFGACHRAHASIDAIAKLKSIRCMGFLIAKELEALDTIRKNPPQPFVLLTGGSKVSDKIVVLENFADKVASVLIGGAMAYTFLKTQGISVGASKLEADKMAVAKSFLKRMEGAKRKVLLPIDHIIVKNFEDTQFETTPGPDIPDGWIAVDIGPKTRALFANEIALAGSVFWNGPMGVYERKPFDEGSIAMARAMAESDAFTVVGGGDSAAAAMDSGLADQMSHISTGGGASLEYIQGQTLPGIEALKVRIPQ